MARTPGRGATFAWPPRRRLLRLFLGAMAAVATLLLLPVTAGAHAIMVRSTPAAGSDLSQVPSAVTITFSEAPAVDQSTIVVVDGSGKTVSKGRATGVPGDPLEMRVPLGNLLNGVYTVRWKTISKDDGHAAGGSYTFGVGPSAYAASGGPAPALQSSPAGASPPVVAGHWIFYAGLGLLVGGAWVSVFALRGGTRRLLLVTLLGAGAMLAGLGLYGVAQAVDDGTPLAELPGTSLGLGLIGQAVPGLAAVGCVGLALVSRERRRAGALLAATGLAAVTILLHVLTTHAAAGRNAVLEVAIQWAHLASFATWIGGLAAVLLVVGTQPSPARSTAVRRFSQVAAASLAVVGVTGLLSAWDEVAAWAALLDTLFGQLVLVKVALLLALVALGGWNRFRSVPAVERSLRGLRRVGRLEIGVAAVVLMASAVLTSLVPPSQVLHAVKQAPLPQVVEHGTGSAGPLGAPVRATLAVSPGYPGENRFALHAYDTKTGRAIFGRVTLRFEMPSRPEVQPSTLRLVTLRDGTYSYAGDNLTLIGEWRITAQLQTRAATVQIPFSVRCSPTPSQLHQMTMGGTQMVYGLPLGNGWQLQAYLTPDRPGRNTLHLVFTNEQNGPVLVPDIPKVTARVGSRERSFRLLRLAFGTPTANQFYGVATLSRGRWSFHLTATPGGNGPRVSAGFSLNVN